MKRVAEIVIELDVAFDVKIQFDDTIEVSLDCDHCQRTRRTVVFKLGEDTAKCCPGSATKPGEIHPPYPGRILERSGTHEGNRLRVAYRIEYDMRRFVDARYPDETDTYRAWTGRPTWARVHWTWACPSCGKSGRFSTQNNEVRPLLRLCECRYKFCTERDEMPRLRWLDEDTGEWHQAAARFSAPS